GPPCTQPPDGTETGVAMAGPLVTRQPVASSAVHTTAALARRSRGTGDLHRWVGQYRGTHLSTQRDGSQRRPPRQVRRAKSGGRVRSVVIEPSSGRSSAEPPA